MKTSSLTVVLIMAIFAIANTAWAGESPKPTVDSAYNCKVTYESGSAARHTCDNESFYRVDDTNARVVARCETSKAQEYLHAEITLNADQCGDISNCNGVYTLGECQMCTDKKTMRKVAC